MINPDTQSVDEWRHSGLTATLHADDELTEPLPGFRCRVADLMPAVAGF